MPELNTVEIDVLDEFLSYLTDYVSEEIDRSGGISATDIKDHMMDDALDAFKGGAR